MVSSMEGVSQVSILPASGQGKKLYIASGPPDDHVYMFVADAGRYCLHQFNIGGEVVTARVDYQCFEVSPGQFSYGGSFTLVGGLGAYEKPVGGAQHRDDADKFKNLLLDEYPNIATKTLLPSELEDMQRARIEASKTGLCGALGMETASALLGASVAPGVDSHAFAHSCGFKHSEDRSVFLGVMEGPNITEEYFDGLTSLKYSTWKNWTPIPGLGDKARLGKEGDKYELLILVGKKMFALTVEGSSRSDLVQAMTEAAQQILAKNPE